jgi:hypothetical protein
VELLSYHRGVSAEWPHGDVCWHVTSAVNRASIDAHGLDWSRMGAVGGIAAGSGAPGGYRHRPELEGVFLCGTWDDVEFFLSFGGHPLVDVWEVQVEDLAVEDAPDGWLVCRASIPRSRIRLVRSDLPPRPGAPA